MSKNTTLGRYRLITENRKMLNEIVIIRAIACLSVVMLHSIKTVVGFSYEGTGAIDQALLTIAGLLSFGTATFVFISQLLVTYSYPAELPKGFFAKRTKYILLPFIFMGVFYAVYLYRFTPELIPINILYNIFGNYHGWFVLVVFQFYILHIVFVKYLKNLNPGTVLISSLIVNIAYLCIFNFFEPPIDNQAMTYFWENGFVKLFLGWIFYFVVAYYFAINYKRNLVLIKKNIAWIYTMLPISLMIVIYNNLNFDFGYGSKRIDMIFFTMIVIFILLAKFESIRKVPALINMISRYSFGIYLLHFFFIGVTQSVLRQLGIDLGNVNILILFIGAVMMSVVGVFLCNKMPYGSFIVGKVKVAKNDSVSNLKRTVS